MSPRDISSRWDNTPMRDYSTWNLKILPFVFRDYLTKRSELSFPDSCAKNSTTSVSVITFVSDAKIPQVLNATEPEPFQMDEFESDSDSDYDETESEEIVEHRNTITTSGRQIKASVRLDLWWEILFETIRLLIKVHQLVEHALYTPSGIEGDVITIRIWIVAIAEDQQPYF